MEEMSVIDYETLLINLPGHVYWLDRNNVFLGCNEKQAKTIGLTSRHDIVGKTIADFQNEANTQHILNVNNQVMSTGTPYTVEESAYCENGSEIIYLSQKVPLKDQHGNIIGLLGISFDIANIKEKESLFASVAGAIAHDLRTPLASIKFAIEGFEKYLKILIETYEAAIAQQLLNIETIRPQKLSMMKPAMESIKQEVEFANAYIDFILSNFKFKELDTQSYQNHSIATIISDALKSYPFVNLQAQLIHWTPQEDFNFRGNNSYLKNILYNLLKNSLFYIDQYHRGEIYIWVETDVEFNTLHFKDTAQGASQEVLEHMFEGYYSNRPGGTGLGLAFCKIIMESFGGKITAESIQGKYMHFTLSFPKQI